ncbi:MAG: hypothetical protein ACOY82_14080 [Pseudomonadota bacterium]
MPSEGVVTAIRRRLFMANVRKGDSRAMHGFVWCPTCRGEGEACREYADGETHWASFEICEACGGEKAIEKR